ncbi:hypothetical protein GQ43DRAFT_436366 [Delitschia confertaspora ATCC 74209]|uniref:Uncharacterized protein n=1 Tax=Delitschia confertaspora ATCC 74209 TaxID=1513339 RepID=A0A9P4MQI5_9PLEO|nr:hypothetical protein GQ43DRAFT_436366 [Delitschia confertaspora ATCC 74209]
MSSFILLSNLPGQKSIQIEPIILPLNGVIKHQRLCFQPYFHPEPTTLLHSEPLTFWGWIFWGDGVRESGEGEGGSKGVRLGAGGRGAGAGADSTGRFSGSGNTLDDLLAGASEQLVQ